MDLDEKEYGDKDATGSISEMTDVEFERWKEGQPKHLVKEMMGESYATFFEDSEGNDVRDLAERAEAMRDAMREEEITRQYEWDARHGL